MGAVTKVLLSSLLTSSFLIGSASISLGAEEKRDPEKITVTGKLLRVVVMGGDTTGWVVKLDTSLKLAGKDYERIEIDPKGTDLEPYVGKHMEITGTVGVRKGLKRGEYFILEGISIRNLLPRKKSGAGTSLLPGGHLTHPLDGRELVLVRVRQE